MKLKMPTNTKLSEKNTLKESIHNYNLDFFPIDKISIVDNVRTEYNGLDELADSIKSNGQLQRIGILQTPENGKYRLVYGHRRFKAISEILKLESIKVEIVQNENTIINQLIENIQREDLSDYDLATAIHRLKEETGKTDLELSHIIHKSRKWVNDKLSHYEISKMHVDVQSIETSKVVETRSLDKETQKKVLEKVKKKNLSLKETRKEVQKVKSKMHVDVTFEERRAIELDRIQRSIRNAFKELKSYGKKIDVFVLQDLIELAEKKKSEIEETQNEITEKEKILNEHLESGLFDNENGKKHITDKRKEIDSFALSLNAKKAELKNLLDMQLIEMAYEWKR